MNKKTKSFAVGLVAVLCFLLVFAIGFGVTGAWYQAQRQASGTVKMDQGIYLKFTNLKTLDANGNKDLTDKMNGKLLQNDTEKTPLENVSVVPSQLVEIAVPTLAAAQGSVDFYARVKVTYTAKYKDADGAVTGEAVEISPDTMKQLFGDTLDGQLKAGAGWVPNADGYWYFAGADNKLVAMTAAEAGDGENHAIFENGNLQFADWTAGRTDVEKGGPKVGDKEIVQVIVTVLVEVIQAANNPAPTGWALNANA